MKRADELAAIETFLRQRGATRCPPAVGEAINLALVRTPNDRFGTGHRKRRSQSEVRARVAEELAKDPNRTNAAIARVVGCSAMTVLRRRQTLNGGAE